MIYDGVRLMLHFCTNITENTYTTVLFGLSCPKQRQYWSTEHSRGNNKHQKPNTKHQASNTKHQVSTQSTKHKCQHQTPSTKCQVLTQYQAPSVNTKHHFIVLAAFLPLACQTVSICFCSCLTCTLICSWTVRFFQFKFQ